MTNPSELRAFVRESNKIEGITRAPTAKEIAAHETFLAGPLTVDAVQAFVAVVAPGKRLRTDPGMNVRVGRYIAPPGGPGMYDALEGILARIGRASPHEIHVAYEKLHPFMDGNGRSGRVIWLWHMAATHGLENALALSFLHRFYYQTLEASRP